MFLFDQETKTPVSTYTDSYRPPNSVKKTFREPPTLLWKENKFVTKGLAMPPVQSPASHGQQEKALEAAVQEYAYRPAINPTAYQPQNYRVTRREERYNPFFVNEDRYVTWRTAPFNSAAWNKYTTYLPRLPREVTMELLPHGAPGPYPPKPQPLARCEPQTLAAVLARAPGPSLQHAAAASSPSQGYYSPCAGRHYCLRGMDYYADGGLAASRHRHALPERTVRWDTSHFRKAGGVQRGSYTVHPEFVSESCSAPLCS
ncbi:sperm microtubule inner protein 6 [Dromaius novaehollandiae]|uniref:sperm microtubule inner protein 6 n=1 Tax=Dromaius novaehollandiae TaxID=8790 RepID=UPI00311DD7D8